MHTHHTLRFEREPATGFSNTMNVYSLYVKLVLRVTVQSLENVGALRPGNGDVVVRIAVVVRVFSVVQVILMNGVTQGFGGGPVEYGVLRSYASHVHVGWRAGQDAVSLEEAVGVLPHVTQASANLSRNH